MTTGLDLVLDWSYLPLLVAVVMAVIYFSGEPKHQRGVCAEGVHMYNSLSDPEAIRIYETTVTICQRIHRHQMELRARRRREFWQSLVPIAFRIGYRPAVQPEIVTSTSVIGTLSQKPQKEPNSQARTMQSPTTGAAAPHIASTSKPHIGALTTAPLAAVAELPAMTAQSAAPRVHAANSSKALVMSTDVRAVPALLDWDWTAVVGGPSPASVLAALPMVGNMVVMAYGIDEGANLAIPESVLTMDELSILDETLQDPDDLMRSPVPVAPRHEHARDPALLGIYNEHPRGPRLMSVVSAPPPTSEAAITRSPQPITVEYGIWPEEKTLSVFHKLRRAG